MTLGVGRGPQKGNKKKKKKAFGVIEPPHILIVVVITCVCKFVKTRQCKLVRFVHFIMCKLYHNSKRERGERRGDRRKEAARDLNLKDDGCEPRGPAEH